MTVTTGLQKFLFKIVPNTRIFFDIAFDMLSQYTYNITLLTMIVTAFVLLGNQSNLRSAAYEALMELIKNSPRDCYETVKNTTVIILERLQAILQMEVSVLTSPYLTFTQFCIPNTRAYSCDMPVRCRL